MHFDVDANTIFLGLSGSHAYGMARSNSDVDVRGACVPPQAVRDSFYRNFDQFQSTNHKGTWGPVSERAVGRLLEHPTAGEAYRRSDPFSRGQGELDLCVFNVSKLVKLAANGNPNVLELLFLDEQDVLFTTPAWDTLREHASLFLSQKCRHTYTGYAMSQLKRIKGHRSWLLDPPKREPLRKDFDLPEESVLPADVRNQIDESVKKILRSWQVEDGLDPEIKGATQDVLREKMRDFQMTVLRCSEDLLEEKTYELAGASLGLSGDVLYAIKQERKYRAARKHWQQYRDWRHSRNEKRAALEEKYGFDTKHASHLIRLLRTGLEILRTGKLVVRRPDAEELLGIRDGLYSYERLLLEAEDLDRKIAEAAKETSLPRSPPFEKIDEILGRVLGSSEKDLDYSKLW